MDINNSLESRKAKRIVINNKKMLTKGLNQHGTVVDSGNTLTTL